MRELSEIRREIDALDDELARLFVRRLKAVDEVAEAKRASAKAVLDADRERQVLERAARAAGPEAAADVQAIFEAMMSVSRRRQQARLMNPR